MTAVTNGNLALAFARECNDALPTRTHMRVLAMQPPLKVVRAFAQPDGAASVHLHNVSGGVLAGDQLEMQVHVQRGAQAQITSTSATRLYRQRGTSGIARLHNTVRIDEDGLLEYVPDPIIPFAHAELQQHTRITLAQNAGVIWWEVLSPGREAHGERFDYTTLTLLTEIFAGDTPIAIERMHLQPNRQQLHTPAQFGEYSHYATFYACKVGTDTSDLEAQISEQTQALSQSPSQAIWGASALAAHGVAVRGLAHNSRTLMAGLHTLWQCAKQALYQRAAVWPRKIY